MNHSCFCCLGPWNAGQTVSLSSSKAHLSTRRGLLSPSICMGAPKLAEMWIGSHKSGDPEVFRRKAVRREEGEDGPPPARGPTECVVHRTVPDSLASCQEPQRPFWGTNLPASSFPQTNFPISLWSHSFSECLVQYGLSFKEKLQRLHHVNHVAAAAARWFILWLQKEKKSNTFDKRSDTLYPSPAGIDWTSDSESLWENTEWSDLTDPTDRSTCFKLLFLNKSRKDTTIKSRLIPLFKESTGQPP